MADGESDFGRSSRSADLMEMGDESGGAYGVFIRVCRIGWDKLIRKRKEREREEIRIRGVDLKRREERIR